MELPIIRAKIVKIEDGSGYEGKVYDQYVFIKLSNGKVIGLFDPDMLANRDLLNKVKEITIDIVRVAIEKLPAPKYDVEPAVIEEDKYQMPSYGHVFFGRVVNMKSKYHDLVIDIGVGKIGVTTVLKKDSDFEIGDFVKVFGSQATLEQVDY